jgi:hypothetical protein
LRGTAVAVARVSIAHAASAGVVLKIGKRVILADEARKFRQRVLPAW